MTRVAREAHIPPASSREPPVGFLIILYDAQPVGVSMAQVDLRPDIPLLRCGLYPLGGCLIIL